MSTLPPSLLLLLALFAGALLDFIFNGVFKIVWIVIYGPAYLAAIKVLIAKLANTPLKAFTRPLVGAFLSGALLIHILLTSHASKLVYKMAVVSTDPITLQSADWEQKLILQSDRLSEALRSGLDASPVAVVLARTTNYGCTVKLVIQNVAGIDIIDDPKSRWVWKSSPMPRQNGDEPLHSTGGPGSEDQSLPWCRYKFYRGPT